MVKEEEMSEDDIDDIIYNIFRHDGPDGHIDGSDVVVEFVMALLADQGRSWRDKYLKKIEKRGRMWEGRWE